MWETLGSKSCSSRIRAWFECVVSSWVTGLNPQAFSFWERIQHWSLLWRCPAYFKKVKIKEVPQLYVNALCCCLEVSCRRQVRKVSEISMSKPLFFSCGFGDHRKPAALHETTVNVFFRNHACAFMHIQFCKEVANGGTNKQTKTGRGGEKICLYCYLDLESQKR